MLASHLLSRDIHINRLSITFHGVELLSDTRIELNTGRRYGLVGLNGSGMMYIHTCTYIHTYIHTCKLCVLCVCLLDIPRQPTCMKLGTRELYQPIQSCHVVCLGISNKSVAVGQDSPSWALQHNVCMG